MDQIRINLPLTDLHYQGTLALSAAEILTLLRSYYRQDSHFYKVHFSSQKSFYPYKTPAYHTTFGWSIVSVIDLTPSILETCNLDK